jgi:diguanylate cyclase (GGDEF)-like protein
VGEWFFAPELVALFVLLVLLFYMRGSYSVAIQHTRAFYTTLWISAASIAINIVGTAFIVFAPAIPRWLNDMVQLMFFSMTPVMSAAIVSYILLQVRDEFHDKRTFTWVFAVFVISLIINLVITLTTPFTHLLYYYDEQFNYIRGPLNFLTMGLTLFYILCGISLCLILQKFISPQLLRVLRWFPILVLVLLSIQIALPNVQLSGTAAMLCCLVCYLNFQSSKLTTDSLTLCGNRLVFLNSLDYYMRHKQALTIIAVNIRQFKKINEELGTFSGDHLLKNIADTLKALPCSGDVFRIGGDKFALICQPSKYGTVSDVLRNLTERLCTPWVVDNVEINLEADIVTLMCPQVASDPDEILSFLEYAMALPPEISDESQIPAQVETRVCDTRMRSKMLRRKEVVTLLRRAIVENGFSYVYQPIMDIDGRQIRAVECLLRLNDPKTGRAISPSEFIPYAEASGLILQIGLKVFENVCKFLHQCDERGISVPPVSVNFSTRQFYSDSMVEHIGTLLARWNVDPAKIKIEVTESTFIANFYRVETVMTQLISMGIGFYLDDFGTGYASFSRMMSLPFECIKFDQSILSDSQRQQRMHEMLGYLVQGFSHLGTRVVVEGVETAEQIAYLKNLKVQNVQGFYYSRPMMESSFMDSLAASQKNGDVWSAVDKR